MTHANTPLPRLSILDASFNKIQAANIDKNVPVSLTKIVLSGNPLGSSQQLLCNLSQLKRLKEAKFEKCEIGDDSLPSSLFTPPFFQALVLLDLSDTQVNLDAVKGAFKDVQRELNHDFSTESPPNGVLRILAGKVVLKESWELELEQQTNSRKLAAAAPLVDDWNTTSFTKNTQSPAPVSKTQPKPRTAKPREVIKEAWELEAEQGLATEGGRRRARAAAAAEAEAKAQIKSQTEVTEHRNAESPATTSSGLSNPQYYTKSTQTLKLPASAPPTKSASHARAFSMATPSATSRISASDISVPTPTLPLDAIVNQPFADSLRVLLLTNRRMDRSFAIPDGAQSTTGYLNKLEELDLEGCNLEDSVSVRQASDAGVGTPPRSTELLIPTLVRLFPSLRTLNLSYNALTSAALNAETVRALVLAAPHRQGLRHLRLRGNRITELDGLVALAVGFKGNRDVPECKLEELDLRDNEIGRLPPELGLLPLDVFLVDGNTYVRIG